MEASIPPSLIEAARPLLNQIVALNAGIQQMDRGIEQLGNRYPEIPTLRTVPGIGPLIAAPGGRVPRPASAAKPVRRFGSAASNIENRQRLSA
ncbi:MAG: hypothetical protein ABSE51_04290 [Terracidiphilus sp.]